MKRAMKELVLVTIVWAIYAFGFAAFVREATAETNVESQRIPVVLSTDVGNEIDDQWAIAYMFANPQFNILAVVSAQAPTLPDPSAHSTYLVLRDEVENRLGLKVHPPLFEGSSRPLEDTGTPHPNEGTKFLIAASHSFDSTHRLVVLTIGAATDVASAILEDPSIVNRIKIVAMAFSNESFDGAKEFNVQNDPKAWQVLLRSGAPITIGSGDICEKFLALNLEQAKDLLQARGPVGAWLWGEYRSWYYRFVKPLRVDDFSQPWFIWDIITLADIEGFVTEQVVPRPQLANGLTVTFPKANGENQSNVTWITAVDSKRLWADFADRLDSFQRSHAVRGPDETDSVAFPGVP